jgi:hypothetical protein
VGTHGTQMRFTSLHGSPSSQRSGCRDAERPDLPRYFSFVKEKEKTQHAECAAAHGTTYDCRSRVFAAALCERDQQRSGEKVSSIDGESENFLLLVLGTLLRSFVSCVLPTLVCVCCVLPSSPASPSLLTSLCCFHSRMYSVCFSSFFSF